ncbi:MAG TPA: preprotein translocase subunit YajC, partial [Blastocatellia bacterium]|nr:preprotein translocase subunit YajC [Blastocatellia bacterium]
MSFSLALILQQSSPLGFLGSFFPILLVIGLFYFMIIVPQRKRQREMQQMLDNLKAGDKVVT